MSIFYSQELAKQRIENLCARCDTKFAQWSQYHAHVTGPRCAAVIKPVNTSGRSKAEIVNAWESRQKEGAIIS